jgi:hypothetical protein
MTYRYKYQIIQALDEKIGRDLRTIVEGYLGPDPEEARAERTHIIWVLEMISESFGAPSDIVLRKVGPYRNVRRIVCAKGVPTGSQADVADPG